MTPQLTAFLTMIAWSEGTSIHPLTKCLGYDVVVTGVDGKPEVFTDFRDHPFANGRPPKVINSHGLVSTASGRYQILVKDWPRYKALLRLPDFSALSQDAYATQIIRETGALPDIEKGNLNTAIARTAHLWASLPGADYGYQRMHQFAQLLTQFKNAGGHLS